MHEPMIVTVAHRRLMQTVLGEQHANITYGGYLDNLARAGARPVILAPGTRPPDLVVDRMDGLLLTGGGDVDPARFDSPLEGLDVDDERDALEIDLVRACRERRIPVLGMCRGNQVLAVALGGSLENVEGHVQSEPLTKPVHTVELRPGCRLARVLGEDAVAVNTFHRWAVASPPAGFAVTGRTEDGVAEAVEWEDDDWFALGTQWHAELLDGPHVPALFSGFVRAAAERGQR
jgi:putative glutamine amidotransferase